MILLSTFWRIFFFSIQQTLLFLFWGLLKLFVLCLILNQSLILFCIYSSLLTLLHENWDLYLQVFSILQQGQSLKHGHDSHRQNFYVVDNHILLCLCRMLYRHLNQWKIQSIYRLEFYFVLFYQGYIQQNDSRPFLFYWERDFLPYLNRILSRFM